MNRKLTIAVLAAMALLPSMAADVATVTKQPNGSLTLDAMDPNTAQAFYDAYVAPQVAAQIHTVVTSQVDTAVDAARGAIWQKMNEAIVNSTAFLQTQMLDNEAASLNALIAGAQARLEVIGPPFSGSPTP